MGFHKKFISKKGIISNLDNLDYFNCDSLVFEDNWSFKFYKDLNINERHLRNKIIIDLENKSGCPDSHKDYNLLKSMSETLISLKTNTSWLDIHFTKEKLGLQYSIEIIGSFEEQRESCINKLIEYFN